jgi:catechol 2,3-dioxygenase-like lactoylglutathione lyase family enzyme
MPVVTFDHIHLRSPDPEATATWLADMLGGSAAHTPGRSELTLGGMKAIVTSVSPGDGIAAPPVTPYQGLDHFGLAVTDIDAMAAELKGKGVEFTTEPKTLRPGIRVCFLRGPQGISIELLERNAKYQ